MRKPSRMAKPTSTSVRPAERRASASWRGCSAAREKPLNPANRHRETAHRGIDRRIALHRLHAVHQCLSGRCHRRRRQTHAYRADAILHRLRLVRCRPVRSTASRWSSWRALAAARQSACSARWPARPPKTLAAIARDRYGFHQLRLDAERPRRAEQRWQRKQAPSSRTWNRCRPATISIARKPRCAPPSNAPAPAAPDRKSLERTRRNAEI